MQHAEQMKHGVIVLPSASNAQGAINIVTTRDGVCPGHRARKLVDRLPDKTLGQVARQALVVPDTTTANRMHLFRACQGQMSLRGRMDSFHKSGARRRQFSKHLKCE
jgi:hypothetical protein